MQGTRKHHVLAALILIDGATACSVVLASGWSITEMARTDQSGALSSGLLRTEMINWKTSSDGSTSAMSTVNALLDISTGSITSDSNTDYYLPGGTYQTCKNPNFIGGTANYGKTPTGARVGTLTNGMVNVSWAEPGAYITGSGSGTEGTNTFTIPGATEATWWYSHTLDRLLAVYMDSSYVLGLAACINATGQCLTSAAPTLNAVEFNPEIGSVRVLDDESLVEIPLPCCLCSSYDTFIFSLAGDGKLQLSPALTSGGCYDVDADEVWVAQGITGANCDDTITVSQNNYATGQTVASMTISAAELFAVFGGECGNDAAGDGSGLPP